MQGSHHGDVINNLLLLWPLRAGIQLLTQKDTLEQLSVQSLPVSPAAARIFVRPGDHSKLGASVLQLKIWSVNSTFSMTSAILVIHNELTAHNWQKWKRVFLTCPCRTIYRGEAVGLKSCKYTWKITIFVKMWNLGQYLENLIFCQ